MKIGDSMLKAIIIFFVFVIGILNVIMMLSRKKIASSIRKRIRGGEERERNTPKLLYGMETKVLPIIEKDYPNIDIKDLKVKCGSNIIYYLQREYDNIEAITDTYKEKLNNKRISNYEYKNINIHRVIIKKYDKTAITFQMAVEYILVDDKNTEDKVQDRFEQVYVIEDDIWKLDSIKSV